MEITVVGTDYVGLETGNEAIKNADAFVISTEWSIFKTPNLKKLKDKLNEPVIFDGRNLYDISVMEEKDIYYSSIGRKTANKC